MALYQFPIDVIPNDYKKEEFTGNEWEGSKYNSTEFIKKMLDDLKKSFEYNTELLNTVQFGKEKGLLIDFMTGSNGEIEVISIRIHVGYLKEALEDIKKLVTIFSRYEVYAWTGNYTKIALDYDVILDEISRSLAYKYIKDPIGTMNKVKYRPTDIPR